MRDPDTSPNTIDILEPDLAEATALAAKLADLPEVAHARTIESFVPKDQDEKLALIDDASFFFQNTMTPVGSSRRRPRPRRWRRSTRRPPISRIRQRGVDTPAAAQARRLAGVMTELAKGAACSAARGRAPPRHAASDDAPAGARSLERRAGNARSSAARAQERAGSRPTERCRIEVAPKGDANDNVVLRRFVEAVRDVAPQATGTPIFVVEAAATIVRAFLQAAVWSLVSIALILFIVLRRWTDVALTLVPLLVAIVATLEICVSDRPAAQLRQHHRAAAAARGRGRVQDLLRHGVAGGRDELPAIAADARGPVQRLHHGHRLRQSVVFASSRHVEHGQADGARAGDDALGRRAVPARVAGDAKQAQYTFFIG